MIGVRTGRRGVTLRHGWIEAHRSLKMEALREPAKANRQLRAWGRKVERPAIERFFKL